MGAATVSQWCAQCLSAAGPFMLRPYGKDKALVRICERCENEHPRSGRYSFSEATREIPKINGHHTKLRR